MFKMSDKEGPSNQEMTDPIVEESPSEGDDPIVNETIPEKAEDNTSEEDAPPKKNLMDVILVPELMKPICRYLNLADTCRLIRCNKGIYEKYKNADVIWKRLVR
jgi:hypothetical protein